jgi:hypothetical protein
MDSSRPWIARTGCGPYWTFVFWIMTAVESTRASRRCNAAKQAHERLTLDPLKPDFISEPTKPVGKAGQACPCQGHGAAWSLGQLPEVRGG